MTCVLCGKTSIKIERFTISPEARKMLDTRFPGMNHDEVSANNGVCGDCLALPLAERRKLADKVIRDDLDEYRRDLMKDALKKREN
jgi:hypothetical protein